MDIKFENNGGGVRVGGRRAGGKVPTDRRCGVGEDVAADVDNGGGVRDEDISADGRVGRFICGVYMIMGVYIYYDKCDI